MPRLFPAVAASLVLMLATMVGWTLADADWASAESPSKAGVARQSAHPRPSSAPKRTVGQAAGPRNYYQELFSMRLVFCSKISRHSFSEMLVGHLYEIIGKS